MRYLTLVAVPVTIWVIAEYSGTSTAVVALAAIFAMSRFEVEEKLDILFRRVNRLDQIDD